METQHERGSVVSAFAAECEGSGYRVIAPLHDAPAHISLTVYEDGSRDVGCGYLDVATGGCRAERAKGISKVSARCIQLFAVSSEVTERTPASSEPDESPLILEDDEEAAEELTSKVDRAIKFFQENQNQELHVYDVMRAIWPDGKFRPRKRILHYISQARDALGSDRILRLGDGKYKYIGPGTDQMRE